MPDLPPRPGDEPGPNQTGEVPCPDCRGTGQLGGRSCETCAGSGVVRQIVGDA